MLGIIKKEKPPVTYEEKYLLQEIALTKNAIESAYSNFENAVDPDLIDCYIYQLNSEQKRYKYLIQRAKEANFINETPFYESKMPVSVYQRDLQYKPM